MRPTRNRVRFRIPTVIALAVLVVAPAVATASAASAAPGDGAPAPRPAATGVPADVLAAMQRDLGLTAKQATTLIARQTAAVKADRTAQAALGSTYAGSWFDAASGTLVVASTDAAKAPAAVPAGVRVRAAKHSKAQLDAIRSKLDALAGTGSANGLRNRPAPAARDAAVAGLTGWYVDPKTNTVVVTTVAGQTPSAAAKDLLAQYGDAVRIEQLPAAPQFASSFFDGGDAVNGGSCSAGFNVRSQATGLQYLIIAGHCVSAGSTLTGQDGTAFGPVLESYFPTYDDALVRNDNTGYWIQGPWVDTNPSSGNVITTTGYSDAPVGTAICKSGITTKFTCGFITGKDETVTYDGTSTVSGLTRHSACVEKGDSGGANFATTSGYPAEGMTSGAMLYTDIVGGLRCGAHVGQETVSWYFPIADSLGYYGPAYQLSTWQ